LLPVTTILPLLNSKQVQSGLLKRIVIAANFSLS
jgi:hypothetical protein